jgi:hypothetical protein
MHFKQEIRQSPTEASECERERNAQEEDQDQDGNNKLGKMSHKRKGEHGRKLKG